MSEIKPRYNDANTEKTKNALDILIAGGSIAGLVSGIVLKHAGHNVHIIEQGSDQRESHMAGVGLGSDFREFLTRHDRLTTPFKTETDGARVFNQNGNPVMTTDVRRDTTSWDALYYRLRANFDRYTSVYCPEAPLDAESDGLAVYHSHNRIVDIIREPGNQRITVTVQNTDTKETTQRTADYVVGADGPNSFVRSKYIPSVQRNYAGCVVWPGVVLESELSQETRDTLAANLNVLFMARQNCVVYLIPGENGSLKPGERVMNWAWYTNEKDDALANIMVDNITGHRHHYTVPSGHLREEVWSQHVKQAEAGMTAPFAEVGRKIKNPFVQQITSYCSPQATFEDGRVLLVGDALALYRPHIGASGTQGAFNALCLGQYIQGEMTLGEYEERVMRYATLHWSQAEWIGSFFMLAKPFALPPLARFYWYCGLDRFNTWWTGKERLLRT